MPFHALLIFLVSISWILLFLNLEYIFIINYLMSTMAYLYPLPIFSVGSLVCFKSIIDNEHFVKFVANFQFFDLFLMMFYLHY